MPKVVFTTTPESAVGNTRLARDDVGAEVSRLKEQSGKDIAAGGAGLAGACRERELIEEWRLFVRPVMLGAARPTSGSGRPINLELVETKRFGSRVVYLRYRRVSAEP